MQCFRSQPTLLAALLVSFQAPMIAQVGPGIVNPANGHTYYLSTSGLRIGPAQQLAASMGGYLVAINDAAEDTWIAANFPNIPSTYLWIGLQRPAPGLPFSQWDSGEPLTYTNWCPGEPNSPQTEFYVMANWCGGGWNDAGGGSFDVWHALIEVAAGTYATFGTGCPGSLGVSTLTATTMPRIGHTMTVDVSNLLIQAAVMMVGLSNTNSAFGPLPVSLAPFGMPGCFGRVRPDATGLITGGVTSTFTFAIPASTQLLGLRFFQQALVFDPLAGNPASAVVSDAAVATIGL